MSETKQERALGAPAAGKASEACSLCEGTGLEPEWVEEDCAKCEGRGYHHGFGEADDFGPAGVDPDWCTVCGGPGHIVRKQLKRPPEEGRSGELPAMPPSAHSPEGSISRIGWDDDLDLIDSALGLQPYLGSNNTKIHEAEAAVSRIRAELRRLDARSAVLERERDDARLREDSVHAFAKRLLGDGPNTMEMIRRASGRKP